MNCTGFYYSYRINDHQPIVLVNYGFAGFVGMEVRSITRARVGSYYNGVLSFSQYADIHAGSRRGHVCTKRDVCVTRKINIVGSVAYDNCRATEAYRTPPGYKNAAAVVGGIAADFTAVYCLFSGTYGNISGIRYIKRGIEISIDQNFRLFTIAGCLHQ